MNHPSDKNDTINGDEETPLTRNGNGEPKRRRPRRDTLATGVTIVASVAAILLCVRVLVFSPAKQALDGGSQSRERPKKQLFDSMGRYVLEDYDAQPTFSDFLPGVAGVYGKPLWSFYVNRGQGIASFGIKSKDFPIMEFKSANKAYQDTPLLGFRTFLKGSRAGNPFLVEPFSPLNTRFQHLKEVSSLPKRYMYVGTNEMQIQEVDLIHHIEINVTYFTLPEEDFGSLVRRVTITNIDQQRPLNLSLLDGLARLEPAGGELNRLLKGMGRTLEDWMGVYRPYNDTLTMPFFKLSMLPSDTASVMVQEAGHYCLSMIERHHSSELLPIVYDPSKVFGEDSMMLRAIELEAKTVGEIVDGPQYGFAKTPSAFAAVDDVVIGPNKTLTISTFLGKANQILQVPIIARRITQTGFVQYKLSRARELIKQITASVETKTGHHLFNGHVQQMYLDNSLRGGIPIILGEVDDLARMRNADEDERLKVYHLFSRIHGDLERDYNDFVINPTFFSQGPGNYRDVVQNRRSDVIFNPRIGSFNVKMFLSFIQPDGYEPLSVEAVAFSIKDEAVCGKIAMETVGRADGHRAQREALSGLLCAGPFRPGQLFLLMEQQNIFPLVSWQEFIDMVAASATVTPMAVYQTGFWADHWTYYIELIDSYLAIYPDGEQSLMYDQNLPYFFSPAFVQPRSKKYVLSTSFQGTGHHVRQLGATVEDQDMLDEMSRFIDNSTNWYMTEANWTHDESGAIFKSSPIAKLFLLATVKFATRDPFGMAVEYEAGRPGWNDAMNGLVSMVGSGTPELYELEILVHYILSVVSKYDRPIVIPVELAGLVDSINGALDELDGYVDEQPLSKTVPVALFDYWDTVTTAREAYRTKVKTGFSGRTTTLKPDTIIPTLRVWIKELDKGKARAFFFGTHGNGDDGSSGIAPTYFSYNVTKWTKTGERNKDGHPLVIPRRMKVGVFPLFLEGPVRYMKTVDVGEAHSVYQKVRNSVLRDEGLSMYTVSASLKGQSSDMGRMTAFSPGWLENESVWLHMSYKFYLELLRHDMFDAFFDEMKSGGILPFMNPDQYGRSLMECSSFIASSAFDDPSVRGRGFLARLSGSTAEFLSMWVLLMIGPKPFFIDADTGELHMQLLPALPFWFFENDTTDSAKKEDKPLVVEFKLFAAINVYYHNVRQTDLLRTPPSRYEIGLRDGSTHTVHGPSIAGDLADKIRRVVFVDYISAYF